MPIDLGVVDAEVFAAVAVLRAGRVVAAVAREPAPHRRFALGRQRHAEVAVDAVHDRHRVRLHIDVVRVDEALGKLGRARIASTRARLGPAVRAFRKCRPAAGVE
jgi:hypothetical protein